MQEILGHRPVYLLLRSRAGGFANGAAIARAERYGLWLEYADELPEVEERWPELIRWAAGRAGRGDRALRPWGYFDGWAKVLYVVPGSLTAS